MQYTKEMLDAIENLKAEECFAFKDPETGFVFEYQKDADFNPEEDMEENNLVNIYLFMDEKDYTDHKPCFASTENIHFLDLKEDVYKEDYFDMNEKPFHPYSPNDVFYLDKKTFGVPHTIWKCNYAEVDIFTGETNEQKPFIFEFPMNHDAAMMKANRILSGYYDFVEYEVSVFDKNEDLEEDMDVCLSENKASDIVINYIMNKLEGEIETDTEEDKEL